MLAALLTLTLPGTAAAADETRYTTGRAFDLATDQLLYTEAHEEIYQGDQLKSSTVSYRAADGKPFASKQLDFAANPFLPDFELDDPRSNYREGAKKQGDALALFTGHTDNPERDEKLATIPAPAVADAGFNLFVRDNWSALIAEQSVGFNFAVPSKHDWFRFTARKIEDIDYAGRPAAVVEIATASTLLSLLTDAIKLTYDLDTGKLIEYRGLSNVKDSTGNNLKVRITYALDEIGAAAPQ